MLAAACICFGVGILVALRLAGTVSGIGVVLVLANSPRGGSRNLAIGEDFQATFARRSSAAAAVSAFYFLPSSAATFGDTAAETTSAMRALLT